MRRNQMVEGQDDLIFGLKKDVVERALLNGGHTIQSLVVAHGLSVREQEFHDQCVAVGVETSPRHRTPMWYALRHKNPRLADRNYVVRQIRKHRGVTPAARKLGVKYSFLFRQVERLKISLRELRVHRRCWATYGRKTLARA